jgi:hypothetical protein
VRMMVGAPWLSWGMHARAFIYEFCYWVYNQYELFIYLDLMVKNVDVTI